MEERLKIEELKAQIEMEKIRFRAGIKSEGDATEVRMCTRENGESPNMFIVRMKTYLKRSMQLSETPQTYDELQDLFVRGQFLDVCPADV